jgi:hypothetical protein
LILIPDQLDLLGIRKGIKNGISDWLIPSMFWGIKYSKCLS